MLYVGLVFSSSSCLPPTGILNQLAAFVCLEGHGISLQMLLREEVISREMFAKL